MDWIDGIDEDGGDVGDVLDVLDVLDGDTPLRSRMKKIYTLLLWI